MTYTVFCLGNPLLDIQATGGEKLLEKYELKANDAILAEKKHSGMFVQCTVNQRYRCPDSFIATKKS